MALICIVAGPYTKAVDAPTLRDAGSERIALVSVLAQAVRDFDVCADFLYRVW